MLAIDWPKYGPPEVLRLVEREKPVPRDNELLIRVIATNIFPGDCEMRRFQVHPSMWLMVRLLTGVFRPRVRLGQEFAGEIEAVGKAVTRFKAGEQIFGGTKMKVGTYAEYICLPEEHDIIVRPEEVNPQSAATIPLGGVHALHFLRKANLQSGEKILVFGAGGCIGTYAVQLAKLMGAEVTVVDSANKLPMLRELGADFLIDFEKDDFTRASKKYDVIFDVVGKSSYARSLKSLTGNGRYVLANVGFSIMLRGVWTSMISDKNVLFELAKMKRDDLSHVAKLMAEGKMKAAIDRCYSLEEMIDAHRYIETGRRLGHVVVQMKSKKRSE